MSQHCTNTCFPVSTPGVLTPVLVSQQLPNKANLCTNVHPQTLVLSRQWCLHRTRLPQSASALRTVRCFITGEHRPRKMTGSFRCFQPWSSRQHNTTHTTHASVAVLCWHAMHNDKPEEPPVSHSGVACIRKRDKLHARTIADKRSIVV